jgi:hypothetical protein
MTSLFYMLGELVASHSVAVMVTATLAVLVMSGAAGRAVLRLEERLDSRV